MQSFFDLFRAEGDTRTGCASTKKGSKNAGYSPSNRAGSRM